MDSTPTPQVYILDDDLHMREALVGVLGSMDLEAKAFEHPAHFLAEVSANSAGCLLLDVRMPGADGLELQTQFTELGYRMPIIFITGFGDIPMTVQAMKAGAADFLAKPFDDSDLIKAVRTALARDEERQQREAEFEAVISLGKLLTNRERQVMEHVVKGLMNKQIAYELGLTEITVKLHRASLMKKLQTRTLPDLVRRAELLYAKGHGHPQVAPQPAPMEGKPDATR